MKLCKKLVSFLLIFVLQNLAFAAPSLTILGVNKCFTFYNNSRVNFIAYPNDTFMAFRSNAPHYWDFIRTIKQQIKYQKLFKIIGSGVGDSYFLNFSDVELRNGKRTIGNIDFDDAGLNIPLLFDLAREIIASEIAPIKINRDNLIASFFDGLKNIPLESNFINSIFHKSKKDFAKLYTNYINKNTVNNKFSEDSGVQPLDAAPENVKRLFQSVENVLLSTLLTYQPNLKILDFGFKIKNSGGSKGIPRFLFLIESASLGIEIIEFKEYIESSATHLANQGSKYERFYKAKAKFYPSSNSLGLLELVQNDHYAFTARTKLPHFIDFKVSEDMKKDDKKNLIEFINYRINMFGLILRNELSPLELNWLLDNKKTVTNTLSKFIDYYLQEFNKLNLQ